MIKKAIRVLATCRKSRGALKRSRTTAHATMLRTEEGVRWATLDINYKARDKTTKNLEATIRKCATDIYARAVRIFGAADKKHWKGVTIKDYTTVVIDPNVDLVEWAQIHVPLLVSLSVDMKMFGALVKAGKIPAEIAWVEKEPRAQIASKL